MSTRVKWHIVWKVLFFSLLWCYFSFPFPFSFIFLICILIIAQKKLQVEKNFYYIIWNNQIVYPPNLDVIIKSFLRCILNIPRYIRFTSMSMWADILGNKIIGLLFLLNNLTEESYYDLFWSPRFIHWFDISFNGEYVQSKIYATQPASLEEFQQRMIEE